MKLIAYTAGALLMIVLIAGCTSQVLIPSAIGTQTPGPEIVQPAETSLTATTLLAAPQASPRTDVAVNNTQNGVFLLNPMDDYRIGDIITVNGTTILSAGDPLLVEVVSSSFGPTPKTSPQAFSGVSGVTTVKEGPPGGPNTWSFSFPTDGFVADSYIVTVSGLTIKVRDSTTFLLKPRS